MALEWVSVVGGVILVIGALFAFAFCFWKYNVISDNNKNNINNQNNNNNNNDNNGSSTMNSLKGNE